MPDKLHRRVRDKGRPVFRNPHAPHGHLEGHVHQHKQDTARKDRQPFLLQGREQPGLYKPAEGNLFAQADNNQILEHIVQDLTCRQQLRPGNNPGNNGPGCQEYQSDRRSHEQGRFQVAQGNAHMGQVFHTQQHRYQGKDQVSGLNQVTFCMSHFPAHPEICRHKQRIVNQRRCHIFQGIALHLFAVYRIRRQKTLLHIPVSQSCFFVSPSSASGGIISQTMPANSLFTPLLHHLGYFSASGTLSFM